MIKKKIIEFPGLVQGGVGSVVMNLFRNIDKQKLQIDFCVPTEKESKFDSEILKDGGNIYRIPQIRKAGIRGYIKNIETVLIQHGPYDGIHVHSVHMGVFALIAARNVGIPLRIFHVHNTKDAALEKIPVHTLLERFLDKLIIKNATVRLACGHDAGLYVYGENTDFEVINNAVCTERFYPYEIVERESIRQDLGFLEEDVVVGNIARFNEEKNQEFLVDLVAEDKRNSGRLKIMLVGEGPLFDKVQQKAKKLGCLDRISFFGVRSDVERMYNAMDVFCLPSLFEGLPVTAIEAQACGTSCITSTLVTSEADLHITPYKRINLNEDLSIWINVIYEYANRQRLSANKIKELLIAKEYETTTVINKVVDIYLGK